MEIMINDGAVPCKVENTGYRTYRASFLPTTTVPHVVQMRFNSYEVEGKYSFVFIESCFFSLIGNLYEILLFTTLLSQTCIVHEDHTVTSLGVFKYL
jgi:hypothetical protein